MEVKKESTLLDPEWTPHALVLQDHPPPLSPPMELSPEARTSFLTVTPSVKVTVTPVASMSWVQSRMFEDRP